MAQIIVKTPVTTNGRDPLLNGGQQVFKTTIVEAGARDIFEKMNVKLPDHLKRVIEPYQVETAVTGETQTVESKKSNKNATT